MVKREDRFHPLLAHLSRIARLSADSPRTTHGLLRRTDVPGPLRAPFAPENGRLTPATVEIMPSADTRRTRPPPKSAHTKPPPSMSRERPRILGVPSFPRVAGVPSGDTYNCTNYARQKKKRNNAKCIGTKRGVMALQTHRTLVRYTGSYRDDASRRISPKNTVLLARKNAITKEQDESE